jgi:hypothetical protein
LHQGRAAVAQSRTLITRWCGRHTWVERSIEYDREMERREREGEIRARVEMRRRHATLALLAQKKVTEAVGKLNPDEMKASGLARLLAESTRLERLARGSDEEDGGFASVTIIVGNRHPDPEDQPRTFVVSKFGHGGETA